MDQVIEPRPDHSVALDRLRERLDSYLVRQPDGGRYMIDRAVFTEEALFDLEMKHIFERNWVFLGHEGQIPRPNDFLTTRIGRQTVLLTRDAAGEIRCFLNVCTHRGARLCRERRGNRKHFSCPFHGWTFSNRGKLLDVTKEAAGGYPPGFDREALGLEPVRTETYRGFIFASLNPDVQKLPDYLAGARTFIDLMVDQSPVGRMEILRGATRYTYQGNWKLQVENGLDGYHVGSVHANYFMTVSRRNTGDSRNDTKVLDFSTWDQLKGGYFSFPNGHTVLWNDYANHKDRPNWSMIDELRARHGEAKARWMNGRLRNMLLFPNVFLMDQTSTQIRIIQPLSVNETEVTTYCVAPVGESAAARALRIRQYEDFFNASGMATPDDLTEFNNCQIGFARGAGRFNDMSRGATRWRADAGPDGRDLGVEAIGSSEAVDDEGLYVAIHEEWLKRMQQAIARERTTLEAV